MCIAFITKDIIVREIINMHANPSGLKKGPFGSIIRRRRMSFIKSNKNQKFELKSVI